MPADAWDRLAAGYELQVVLERASLREAVRLAAAGAALGSRGGAAPVVADVGSGTGAATRLLRAEGARRVVAVDASAAMLARASGVRVRGSAAALPLATGSVDVVVCAWLLHVLEDDDRRAAVHEVARVLRPGGRLVAVVPARPRTALGRVVRRLARRAAERAGTRALVVLDDLPRELAAAGLEPGAQTRTHVGYAAAVLVAQRSRRPPRHAEGTAVVAT